jgi:hypothetical protein
MIESQRIGRTYPWRRVAPWTVAGVWLLVALSLQFLVGLRFAHIATSLTPAALLVAGTGLGIALTGSLALRLLDHGAGGPLRQASLLLAVGSGILSVLGVVWVIGDAVFSIYIEGILLATCVVILFGLKVSRSKRLVSWVISPCLVLLLATAGLYLVPNALSLNFRWTEESSLNHLLPVANSLAPPLSSRKDCGPATDLPAIADFGNVTTICGVPGSVELRNGRSGYSLMFASEEPNDSCVRHLDDNWWELNVVATNCPWGFNFVGSG